MDDCTDIEIPDNSFHNVESYCQTECYCSCSCAQSSKRPFRTFGTQTETQLKKLVNTYIITLCNTDSKEDEEWSDADEDYMPAGRWD